MRSQEGGQIKWVKSRGSLTELCQVIEKKQHEDEKEDLVLRRRERVQIISDEAGMGKTTILSRFYQLLKAEDSKITIEKINLNDPNSTSDPKHSTARTAKPI